jgi:hypothetical protein
LAAKQTRVSLFASGQSCSERRDDPGSDLGSKGTARLE